jgi:hypothetical protein
MTGRRSIVIAGLALAAATYGTSLAQAPKAEPPAPSKAPSLLVPTPRPSITAPVPSYDRKGRRDPFIPIEIAQPPEIKPPAVASARLRGIVRGTPPRALLETPDGIGYILKPGDILADGRLVEIGPDSVVFSVPPRRGSTPERIVLRLPND